MARAKLSKKALTHVAFGRGPGSFTGVRIAASIAQGMAYSLDIPIVPVSTLAALAQAEMDSSDAKRVLSIIDARMKEVYHGEYVLDGQGIAALQGMERVCLPETLVAPDGTDWVGVGSGWGIWSDILEHQFKSVMSRKVVEVLPTAAAMAVLAANMIEKQLFLEPALGLPVYLRDKVAQTTDERKVQADKGSFRGIP